MKHLNGQKNFVWVPAFAGMTNKTDVALAKAGAQSSVRCSGQTLVEAVGSLSILILLFICIVYLLMMSIIKVRSLDTAYHLARAATINETPQDTSIINLCFPSKRGSSSRYIDSSMGRGPAIREVIFSFVPYGVSRHHEPWQSSMRVVLSRPEYLERSWPGSPLNKPPNTSTLVKEAAILASQAHLGFSIPGDPG